ncbi:hypothetical protein K439DRAFT_1610539 [Ramaria rubella]|nr:hypothetical protein K439DRAFT_1610539 [Ramaria rubella]
MQTILMLWFGAISFDSCILLDDHPALEGCTFRGSCSSTSCTTRARKPPTPASPSPPLLLAVAPASPLQPDSSTSICDKESVPVSWLTKPGLGLKRLAAAISFKSSTASSPMLASTSPLIGANLEVKKAQLVKDLTRWIMCEVTCQMCSNGDRDIVVSLYAVAKVRDANCPEHKMIEIHVNFES